MVSEKRVWPIWAILVLTLIIVVAFLIPIVGAFALSKYGQQNQQQFKMACVEKSGTWSHDVCVIK
jgi:membrane-associated HD superfamily phosphohydrolase